MLKTITSHSIATDGYARSVALRWLITVFGSPLPLLRSRLSNLVPSSFTPTAALYIALIFRIIKRVVPLPWRNVSNVGRLTVRASSYCRVSIVVSATDITKVCPSLLLCHICDVVPCSYSTSSTITFLPCAGDT